MTPTGPTVGHRGPPVRDREQRTRRRRVLRDPTGHGVWQRGTMGDLVRPTEQMVADNPGLKALPGFLAIVYTEAGRTDDAVDCWQDFAAAGFELPMDAGWIEGVTFYAETAIECRDAEHATGLFDLLAPGPINGRRKAAPRSKALWPTTSVVSPRSSAATATRTSISPRLPPHANKPTPSSSRRGPTSPGEGCSPSAALPVTPRRPGSFSPTRTRRRGTRVRERRTTRRRALQDLT